MRFAADRHVVHLDEAGEDWYLKVTQDGNDSARALFCASAGYENESLRLSADECERIGAALLRAAAVMRGGA